jgi:hypothetical protein
LLNNRRVKYGFSLEDVLEKVGFAQGRSDVQSIPANEPDMHTPPADIALQIPHEITMPLVESIRQTQQGGQLSDITALLGRQVPEVLVVILWKRSAMISSDQANDHAFLGSKRQPGRTNDDLSRQLVMVLRVLRLAHIVEHCRGTKPDPLGVAHAVQRLKLVKKTQGKPRNLKRVICFEAMSFSDSDDGVDDPSASQDASLNIVNSFPPAGAYYCIGRTGKGALFLSAFFSLPSSPCTRPAKSSPPSFRAAAHRV